MSKVTIPARYRYTDWHKVIENSGAFFSRSSMRFFNSRISWNSLTPMNGYYLFITSEQAPNGSRAYTVRLWNGINFTDLDGFQKHDTLTQAKRALKNANATYEQAKDTLRKATQNA
jgi:hypothetical protein